MDFKRAVAVLNTLVLRGLGSGVSVLFTVMISRYLPTESAAHFFLLFNISTIAAVCFRWGLDEVIIRRIAKLLPSEIEPVSRHLTVLSHRRVALWTIVCLLSAFVVYLPVFSNVLPSVESLNLAIALCAATFVALTACAARVLQGDGRTNLATFLLNIVVPGLSLFGLFLLISFKKPDARDLIVLYASVAVGVYLVTVVGRYGNPLALFTAAFKLQWRSADSSAANKLGLVVLAQQVVGWAALLIVPYVYGDYAYKGFVVVQKVATLISLTMLAVNFTFSRRFASLYAGGDLQGLRNMVRYSFLAIIVASLGITLFIVLTRHWLFAYAQIDVEMTNLLLILLASQFFFSISALFSVVLSMAHDDNYLFVVQAAINGTSAVIFIIACQFLPLEAASLLLVASYFVLSLALGLRVHYLTGIAKEA
ncbi:hypothetical protein K3F43_23980 [Pseudomonas tussilaginis]|uniref:lipopolysaccharide biosynthesis protein n=1 Tax=unclassified Pseudomonas TaxID=196821 RepID=UPI00117BD114|nr:MULTISPECIES: hypothetical protein [unclassified Pseudomonas]QYX47689.1 hypothetical protein K3F43_23980 [Pseudomonas sp. S11A 273]